MEVCSYCNKSYKKNGLKIHQSRCKSKPNIVENIVKKINKKNNEIDDKKDDEKDDEIEYIQEMEIVNKTGLTEETKETKEKNEIIQTSYIFQLPDELLMIIKKFLIGSNKKDEFCTYSRKYKNILNISLISRHFKSLFYFKADEIATYKEIIIEERNRTTFKTDAKKTYPVTDTELEKINYKTKRNYYGSITKIYRHVDIIDFLYKKYGTKDNYDKIMELEDIKKSDAKKKSNELKKKRLEKYNELMKKYGFSKDSELYKEIEIYQYVTSGTPGLTNVENYIIEYIEEKDRERRLEEKLIFEHISNQIKNNFKEYQYVFQHIKHNRHTLDEVIDFLRGVNERTIIMKEKFNEKNIDIDNYGELTNEDKAYIRQHVELNKHDVDYVVRRIANRDIRKTLLIERLESNGLKLRNDSELCRNYIMKGEDDIEYVVNTMIEMDFFFRCTNYKEEFKNAKEDSGYYDYEDRTYHYDYIDVSRIAKENALYNWCRKYKSYESAILSKNLPKSLYEKVKVNIDDINEENRKNAEKRIEKEKRRMEKNNKKNYINVDIINGHYTNSTNV